MVTENRKKDLPPMSKKFRKTHKRPGPLIYDPKYRREQTKKIKKALKQMQTPAIKAICKEIGISWQSFNALVEVYSPAVEALKDGVEKFWDHVYTKMIEGYSQGMSNYQVAALIGVSYDTYYDWVRMHGTDEKFVAVFAYCKTLSRAWWDAKGLDNLENPKLNAHVYAWEKKIRFGLYDPIVIQKFANEMANEGGDNEEIQEVELRLKRIYKVEKKSYDPTICIESIGEEKDPGRSDDSSNE